MKSFLIGELAKRAGVNKETVRYYEARGLLGEPDRRSSDSVSGPGYREYTEEAVIQIKIIKQLKQLSFRLSEIKLLFELYGGGARACDDFTGNIRSKIAEIDEETTRLAEGRKILSGVLARCESAGFIEACGVIDRLMRDEFLNDE